MVIPFQTPVRQDATRARADVRARRDHHAGASHERRHPSSSTPRDRPDLIAMMFSRPRCPLATRLQESLPEVDRVMAMLPEVAGGAARANDLRRVARPDAGLNLVMEFLVEFHQRPRGRTGARGRGSLTGETTRGAGSTRAMRRVWSAARGRRQRALGLYRANGEAELEAMLGSAALHGWRSR